eukprot:COSAG02_NODE_35486_length_467_cov_1.320652_1_plen_20_part_10
MPALALRLVVPAVLGPRGFY